MASHPYKRSQLGESSNSVEDAGGRRENASSRAKAPNKETKRMRGEIACAECRRLKVRCDKTIPCSTCVTRGCAALCPNGTIPPGEGSRFVLAATDHLHRKMTKLEARMHSLEDALAIVQANESEQLHPLLQRFFTEDDETPRDEGSQSTPEGAGRDPSTLVKALGTLHIDGEDGTSRFFGPSGDSESLLLQAKEIEAASPSPSQAGPVLQELDPSYLPPEIKFLSHSFPLASPGISKSSVLTMIESFLPTVDRAIALCETFLEHLSWMFQIVSHRQLVSELIPVIYKQRNIPYGPHDLALLLVVLGIGALVDLTEQPYNLEAQHYYTLARAAVTLQSVLSEPSVVTIKVLHLMSIYNGMSGKEANIDQCYSLLDFAGQVAVQAHIDPSLWGFDGKEAYDRRGYFWNLMAAILWQALVTGRPPVILSRYIDCHVPTSEEEDTFQQGEVPLGFGIWGFKASVECLIPVVEATLSTRPPEYDKILELDHKIRAFAGFQFGATAENDRTAISMRTFVRSHYQDLMLMFLHRAFFAQAITEHAGDPLQCPYSRSFVAAYQSACVVLNDTTEQFMKKPLLCARVWQIWSFAFSAAVIVGTVASRASHLNLEPPPLQQFEATCALFQSASDTSSRAARAMPILRIMLQRAHEGRRSYGNVPQPDATSSVFSTDLHRVPASYGGSVPPPPPLQRHRRMLDELAAPLPEALYTPITPPLFSTGPLPSAPDIPENLPHAPTTLAGLPRHWDGVYHEIPGASHSASAPSAHPEATYSYTTNFVGEGAMLDDRWATFLHNYGVMAETDPHYPA